MTDESYVEEAYALAQWRLGTTLRVCAASNVIGYSTCRSHSH